MIKCAYIYCNNLLNSPNEKCNVCGCQDGNPSPIEEAILEKLPSIIDMHQIIPNVNGIIEDQFQSMKNFKIEKAVLQSVPSKLESIFNNKKLFDLKSKHPEPFIISHFMDPRYYLARKRIKEYAKKGVKLIKLLPCLGYYPNHKKFDRFWKLLEREQMVVMSHTGFITARHKAEEKAHGVFLDSIYGNPLYFDKVARKFPNLQIILCHTGGDIWYAEACQMISQHENVWGDICGFGLHALDKILATNTSLDWDKVFWGNDAHPKHYPTNLKIALSKLTKHNRPDLIPKLFRENGHHFINKYLYN